MNNLDLVAERLGGKRYERYVAAKCIFHTDSKPSFFVYDDRYFCASCGARGTTQSLLKRLGSIPDRFVSETKFVSNNPFTRWINQFGSIQKLCEVSSRTRSVYLENRGIPANIQKDLMIGRLENWIVFPIRDRYNEIIGAVARAGQGNTATSKYILPKGQSPQLLYVPSWQRIKEHKEVFVTFGIIDAVTLYILGKASCSTTTGQHINVDAFSGIHKKIVIVPDEMEEISAYKVSTKLGLRGAVKILQYPYGCKDINDWWMSDKRSIELELSL